MTRWPGLRIDDAAHVFQRDREVPGDAGDHGVGVAERHHAGGEMIAVLVDQPLDVADQVALALQALIEIGDIIGVPLGQRGVDDLDAFAELDAEILRALADRLLAADQQRRAEPFVHEGRGGADDLLFLALGEHHALGRSLQPLEHLLQHPRNRIAPRAERLAVGVHVLDRLPRHAGVHRGFRHGGRHVRNQPRVERHRDDVVRPELRPRAVSRGDLVGHVLAGELGERAGRGDLHLHVDGGGADVERAAEDVGKPSTLLTWFG